MPAWRRRDPVLLRVGRFVELVVARKGKKENFTVTTVSGSDELFTLFTELLALFTVVDDTRAAPRPGASTTDELFGVAQHWGHRGAASQEVIDERAEIARMERFATRFDERAAPPALGDAQDPTRCLEHPAIHVCRLR